MYTSGYYYPLYRAYPLYPYGYQSYFYNSGINAFQSQIGYQNFINTGTATNVNQIFSPYAFYR